MNGEPLFLPDGLVTTPKGFLAGATFAGMKTYSKDKMDLGILMSDRPCVTAGMFTRNAIKSPSLVLTQERVAAGNVRAVVANSGIANACVGEQGMTDAKATTALAAKHLGLRTEEVAICSTGLIGVELPMALIRSGMPKIKATATEAGLGKTSQGGYSFARAIMTTDRRPKSAAVRCNVNGSEVTIGGCIKGAGMIHPNMATMLAFLTTDATVEPGFLHHALHEAVDETINMVTVDGDSSTNDTVLLMANGAAGNAPVMAETPAAATFQRALFDLCDHLSRELVRDAEGASKIFGVRVEGARTREDARLAARTVASSSLVKSAIHGNDPNWGRVIAAAGRSGASIEEARIGFFINDVVIMEDGKPIAFHKDAVIAMMRDPEVVLTLRLGLGDGAAMAWGCELTEEYVNFNAAYTT